VKYFSAAELATLLPYSELTETLKMGFRKGGIVPLRHTHTIKTDQGSENNFMLMPCWQQGGMIGVKMVMVCPDNHLRDLESVQSTYILSDATTGEVKAIMSGDELTVRRTACASALASSCLSSPQATSLLMMGTGKLAPHLVRAHASVRSLKDIYIWGRRHDQAEKLANTLSDTLPAKITAIDNPEKYANICDIISCATLANEPILKGKWLNTDKKQHIDLVGGYRYNMREADNDAIALCDIYVDTFDGALAEAGDIIRPIEDGIIDKGDIKGDLYDLVDENFKVGPSQKTTLFKSVGSALEDLIAAQLAYEKFTQQ